MVGGSPTSNYPENYRRSQGLSGHRQPNEHSSYDGGDAYDDDDGGNSGGDCYVVSATFGRSRELCQVHRRCRYVFAYNPLMIVGWLLYKFYGPLIATWSKQSPRNHSLAQTLLARPIVAATSLNPLVAIPAMLWLVLLSIVGLALIVPVSIAKFSSHGSAN